MTKIFYTKNPAGIENCTRCNAAGKFPLTIEEQEDHLWRVYTKCKVCRKEIEIKIVNKQEAKKLAGNRKQMHSLQPPRMGT